MYMWVCMYAFTETLPLWRSISGPGLQDNKEGTITDAKKTRRVRITQSNIADSRTLFFASARKRATIWDRYAYKGQSTTIANPSFRDIAIYHIHRNERIGCLRQTCKSRQHLRRNAFEEQGLPLFIVSDVRWHHRVLVCIALTIYTKAEFLQSKRTV